MKPEIFMDDFERTAWGDAVYSMLGRALTISTRFESLCRTLNVLLSVKENVNILDSEEDVEELVSKMWKLKLAKHISSIATESALKVVLDKGRSARNEIAHQLALGLDRCIDTLPSGDIDYLIYRLRELIKDLGEADRVVSLVASVVTNEHMPSPDFLKKYPALIEKWVMTGEGS